jgi:hypothetical protein
MLLFFVLFIFFILHIQFLLRNIFFGLDELTYFQFIIKFGFDREIAIQSLNFTLACALCFAFCYKLFYRKHRRFIVGTSEQVFRVSRIKLLLINGMGLMMIIYMLALIGLSNFDYGAMTLMRESSGFIFELRVIFLLLISHILLNLPWKEALLLKELRAARWIVLTYLICTLIFQARSAVFELVAVVAFTQLMWAGDKVKFKYVVFVFGAMLVPNLIVLGRLGMPDDFGELIDGLFSFEYSILINKFLSAAIYLGSEVNGEASFIPSLMLLIPSPLRDLLGVAVIKSSYYADVSAAADARGGGFSLLAEMFSNFGWYAPLVFGAIGLILGIVFSKAEKVGNVGFVGATAPLLYVAFVLAFRNDFGVFLKYVVQLFLIAFIFHLVLKRRF